LKRTSVKIKKHKPSPRKKFVRLQSSLTLADLKKLEADGPPPVEQPDTLRLKDIHVAPLVFQWRPSNEELAAEDQLMNDLVRFIEGDDPPRPLDPILITTVGKRFFVLDGHHRLDAYHTARWKGPIPVKYFNGPLKKAQAVALKLNAKNKLMMSRDAKSEAAWRMLVDGLKDPEWRRSHREIMEATTVSRTNIKRMTKALRELGEKALTMTWADVRAEARRQHMDQMGEEGLRDWKEKKARELADYLVKGPVKLIQDPEITARALEMVSSLLPELLVCEWPDEARERLLVAIEECVPEKAEGVREAFDALANPYWGGRAIPMPTPDVTNLPDTAQGDDFDTL
jgi:hypothetical protein